VNELLKYFLDTMSAFSEHAPKSVKVSYAFKIYRKNLFNIFLFFDLSYILFSEEIYKGERPSKILILYLSNT
jgi:hypothetical protein